MNGQELMKGFTTGVGKILTRQGQDVVERGQMVGKWIQVKGQLSFDRSCLAE